MTIYLSPLLASPDDDRDFVYEPKAGYPTICQLMRANVGDIENQGNLGSCTANSTVSACEILLQKAGAFRHLSRLFNYYVTRELEGRLGQQGAVLRNAVKQAARLGLPDERLWGYDESKADTQPTPEVYSEAARHRLVRYERIANGADSDVVNAIKSAIYEGLPVVFGMPVTQQWLNMRGGDLSYRGTKVDPSVGNHAMTIIGYSQDYFVVENSWGTDWGDRGLGYVPTRIVSEFFEAWVIRGFDAPQPTPAPAPTPDPAPAPQPTPSKKTDSGAVAVVIAVIVLLALYFANGGAK